MATATEATQWWISTRGKAEGPFTVDYVRAAAKTGGLSPTTMVCPVGGQSWKPLREWAELSTDQPPPLPPSPSPPPYDAPGVEPILTNPRLPAMANWICIFAIVGTPIMWVLSIISTIVSWGDLNPDAAATGTQVLFDVVDFLVGTGVGIALMVGGLRLRRLRLKGARLTKNMLLAMLILTVFEIVLTIAIGAPSKNPEVVELSGATLLLLLIGLADVAFAVVAVIWLRRNTRHLPLI